MATDPIIAHSVGVAACDECLAMHLYFFNEAGDVVAQATLLGAELVGHAEDVVEICEFVAPEELADAIGPVMGQA